VEGEVLLRVVHLLASLELADDDQVAVLHVQPAADVGTDWRGHSKQGRRKWSGHSSMLACLEWVRVG
jgi:hypothetical protein